MSGDPVVDSKVGCGRSGVRLKLVGWCSGGQFKSRPQAVRLSTRRWVAGVLAVAPKIGIRRSGVLAFDLETWEVTNVCWMGVVRTPAKELAWTRTRSADLVNRRLLTIWRSTRG